MTELGPVPHVEVERGRPYEGRCTCNGCEALRQEGRDEVIALVTHNLQYGLDFVLYKLRGGEDVE